VPTKPTEEAEKKRPDNDKRIVGVRLRLINGSNGLEIISELTNPAHETIFQARDLEGFNDLSADQARSKTNTDKRKNVGIPGSDRAVPPNNRIRTDDYKGEPGYLHAGIHLVARTRDEIQWSCDFDCMIDVGHDPELHLVTAALPHLTALTTNSLHASATASCNPFTDPYPKFLKGGSSVLSGPLRLAGSGPHPHPDLVTQKYYKFTVTLMATGVVLDPHVEAHDD
jgi:hypothetical protein